MAEPFDSIRLMAEAGLQWKVKHPKAILVFNWKWPEDQNTSITASLADIIQNNKLEASDDGYEILSEMIKGSAIPPTVAMVRAAIDIVLQTPLPEKPER